MKVVICTLNTKVRLKISKILYIGALNMKISCNIEWF